MSGLITIEQAVQTLRAGGVVGMPTETVYGLAADARSERAVRRVFELKGRPSTNPLIVHVASVEIAERYAVVSDAARRLFAQFAPGPLTVVLPLRLPPPLAGEGWGGGRSSVPVRASAPDRSVAPPPGPLPQAGGGNGMCALVTAGLDTVGIRIPDHPVALELLRAFDGPLAAPSANVSNHVSPTTAEHVRSEFGDAVPVLDGGRCRVGIESTVVSLAGDTPRILRPGAVTREQIESVIGAVEMFSGHVSTSVAAESPGQQAVHYAPRAPAFRFAGESWSQVFASLDVLQPVTVLLTTFAVDFTLPANARILVIDIGPDPARAAALLYGALRDADARGSSEIYIEMPPDEPRWTALRDRLTRATRAISEG